MIETGNQLIANSHRLQEALQGNGLSFRGGSREVADRAVEGIINFHFLGMHPTSVGRRDIDWSGPQHHHQEWVAQLNRFFQLPSLTKAYADTSDERYAQAAYDYLADWIRAHPTCGDWQIAPYDNTLNLCIRMAEWLESLPVLLASPSFSAVFVEQIYASMTVQLNYLMHHLAPVANWRIAHVDSLLLCGLCLDFLPDAAKWRTTAVQVLNDAFHRQILPDGAHMERTPGYHTWMTNVFQKYWLLSRAMPELGLAATEEAVSRMHDYNLATMRPNGTMNALHDSVGACSGPRAAGWDTDRRTFRELAGLPLVLPPTKQFFPAAGQAMLRDSWEEDALYLTFDATTWGGAHCHLSRNAMQLHAYGRSLIVDPGTLTYETSDPMMAYGKSTRAHSTVNYNGWNQSYTDPVKTRFVDLPGYNLVASLYQGGYWPGQYQWGFHQGQGAGLWGEHHRTMLWVHDRCIIVIDHLYNNATGDDAPSIESVWQLSDGLVEIDQARSLAVTRHDDANVLMLFPQKPSEMAMSLHAGEMDPIRGWLPGDGEYTPSPQVLLRMEQQASWTTDLVTVLIPFRGATPPKVTAQSTAPTEYGPGQVLLTWDNGSTDEVFWMRRMEHAINAANNMSTDAGLVHLQKDTSGQVTRGLVVDGTHLAPYAPVLRPSPATFIIPAEKGTHSLKRE
ncbi:MAG: heparinase II/III family protein [Armatimonadota bacterium]